MKSVTKIKLSASLLLALNFIVINNDLRAQSPPLIAVVPPSPNVQSMQKYGDIPVSAYTGVPNISIPLYTIKCHDISIPISVSYHASGIKVAEEASNVGLGWALNAGGSISRNIIGNDDFLNTAFPYASYFDAFNNFDIADGNYPYQGNIQPNGVLTLINSATTATTSYNVYNNLSQGSGQLVEFQPDQFYYNLPGGISGKFLFRRNRTPILQTLQKVDIKCNALDGSDWDILTPDGFDYKFSQPEYSRGTGEALSTNHISAVYLTKITSPTGNVVTFNYLIVQSNYIQSIGSYTQSRNDAVLLTGDSYGLPSSGLPASNSQAGAQLYNSVYLNYIDYDAGRVVFNYTNDRTDIPSDNKLNSITVYNKDIQGNLYTQPLRKVNFSYGYFSGTNNANPAVISTSSNYTQRLRLDSITISGANNGETRSQPPYVFTYNTALSGAAPSKSSLGRDHWGYYNGRSNTSLIPVYTYLSSTDPWGVPDVSRNPDANFLQVFMLTDIRYPTGGTTHFDYEPNDCDEQKSAVNDNSGDPFLYTILPSPTSPYINTWYYGQTGGMPDADMTDIVSAYSYNNKLAGAFAFNTNPGTIPLGMIYVDLKDQNNNLIQRIDVANSSATPYSGYVITVNIPLSASPGIYHLVAYCDPSYAGNFQHVSVTASWYTQVNSNPAPSVTHPTTYSLAGGLRIKRITDNDGINPAVVKRFIYHYNVGQIPEYSYGRRMSRPEYTYWEQAEAIAITQTGSGNIQKLYYPEHLMRISDSNIPLNGSAQGMAVGYDQVTVNYGENGENGKTVYQYYNNPDYVPAFIWNNYPAKHPYNSNIPDPLNGSLLDQTDYKNVNGQFLPVKEVHNTYYTNLTKQNKVYSIEDHIQLHENFFNGQLQSQNFDVSTAQDRLLNVYTPMQANWTYLTIKDEKSYDSNNSSNFTETLTNYYYDNPNHYLPTRTVVTNSKGELITTQTAYPLDFINLNNVDAVSKGVTHLIDNHRHDVPVEKFTQKTASDGSNARVISSTITAYSATGSSLPSTIYGLQSVVPLTSFTSYAVSGAMNPAYQPELSFDSYDLTNGNLQQQHKVNGINNSYLWGYNKQYPVAQVINASVNDIFFDSFEEGDGNSTLGDARTGHYSYSGSYSHALNGLDPGTYTLSYWSKSGSLWILVVNNNVTVSGSSYTISLGGQIDDVRFYPSAAQMTTYTYDSQVGVTSITDPKGEVSFYEYDGLTRLKNIRDKDRNIIKSFCYNYAGQSTGCLVNQPAYPNDQVSGTYSKTGCGTGYTGSPVNYTVPAGKYISNVSVADADQMAQNDIAANGQNYANANGTCISNINVQLSNTTTTTYQVVFSNSSFNLPFNFTTSGTTTIQVPAGTYSVNVFPPSGPYNSQTITCGAQQVTGQPRYNFTGVVVAAGSNLTVSVQ